MKSYRQKLTLLILLSFCVTLMADSQPPSKPQLTYAIYSESSAEVFWTRSVDDSVNLTYKLKRDGDVVYEGDGLSYFEPRLLPSQYYEYSLSVTGDDGLITDTDGISLSTTDIDSLNSAIVLPIRDVGSAYYSSTAVEFRWSRVSDATIQYGATFKYEVSRDGIVLGVTDGNTFYADSGLESGRSYIFSFVVIRTDTLGETRSVDRRVLVTMPGRFQFTKIPPGRPNNIMLIRYSDTAAELFWDRHPVEARVVATDVFRNDGLFATVPGTSYFDNTRIAGQEYSYNLVAITDTGERSAVASYPSDPDEPPLGDFAIDESNIQDFLTTVSSIVTGEAFNGLVNDALTLGRFEGVEGLQLVSVIDNEPDAFLAERYECRDHGYLTIATPTGIQEIENNISLDSCSLGYGSYHGNIQYKTGASGSFSATVDLVRNRFTGVLEGAAIFGTVELSPEGMRRSVNLFRSSFHKGEGTRYKIDFYKTRTTHATDELNPNDILTLSTSWLADQIFGGNRTITAKTDRKFERSNEDAYFTRGLLLLELFESDVTMSLQANNGDPDTFQFTVQQNGAVNSYTVDWNEMNRLY